ncbi:MAG: metallopeptidase TldD-related protein, partial [Clostridia bacterium]
FSLLSKGYTFQNGKRGKPVEQITVAGNYYELLQNAREFANDLQFPDGGMGSPSADVGELSISGC